MRETPYRPKKGRGAISNDSSRYTAHACVAVDDGWVSERDGELEAPIRTRIFVDSSRSIINRNESPDVPFELSINPYRGCEHGCAYCFARPTHAYLGLSPGLDFETQIYCKPDAPMLLRKELSRPGHRCSPIAVGINTDAYQPAERKLEITRGILEVLQEYRHPFSIVTKSALIERDMDILAPMAAQQLVQVAVSITTLKADVARALEPRAAAPRRRVESVRRLADAGIPVSVMIAPVIPVLTDSELEAILACACEAGASGAGYVLIRLPHEVKDLFSEWLEAHEPLKAAHVMKRIFDTRGGKAYEAGFGTRMRGTGPYAELIAQRFHAAARRLGFGPMPELVTHLFHPPGGATQLNLL
jgi:DNA repair photolyase